MTHRTTKQMFGAIEQTAQAQREDQRDRERAAREAAARLDAPVSRYELLKAIESVANEYDEMGHRGTGIMLRKLVEALS
jgi:predicted phage gp36 major capsid-like protein